MPMNAVCPSPKIGAVNVLLKGITNKEKENSDLHNRDCYENSQNMSLRQKGKQSNEKKYHRTNIHHGSNGTVLIDR